MLSGGKNMEDKEMEKLINDFAEDAEEIIREYTRRECIVFNRG